MYKWGEILVIFVFCEGFVDTMTQDAMNQPRCGVPDVIVPSDVHFHADGSHSRRKRYIIRRKSHLLVQHAAKNLLSIQQFFTQIFSRLLLAEAASDVSR